MFMVWVRRRINGGVEWSGVECEKGRETKRLFGWESRGKI
jgi:hypothetical protein